MSTTAGVFTETVLQSLRVMADKIMFDDRIKQQYIPQIGIIDAVKAAQTANVLPALAREKDVDVVVEWMNACDLAAEVCDTCNFGGPKSSTNTKTYHLDWCYQVGFSADEVDFDNNDFDVQYSIAKQMLAAEKVLCEAFAQYCVAVLNVNKGVNALTTGKGTVSGSDTYVTAAYWNANLVPYFNHVAVVNRFTNPVTLSGANLYEAAMMASYNAGNADGKGAKTMFDSLRLYFDLFNIDLVNSPDLLTYLISTGAVALGNKAYNPTTPEKAQPFTRWRIPSRFIPGFDLDMFLEQTCSEDRINSNFKMKLKADLFVNPTGCDADNTGILTFVCGEPT